MKFLHVISSMDPRSGGPCQGIRNLAPRSLEHGNNVEVVCLDDPNSDYLSHESIKVHALGKGRSAWNYHPALRPWLEKNLPRFDLVILNGLWQYPGYTLSRLARRPDMPPYFVFAHGMLDPWFQRAPERRLKAVRNWFYWKLIEQHVIRRAEAVFFTCAEEMRLARETFRPYQPKRQVNVGYGVAQPPEYHDRMAEAFTQKCPGVKDRPYFIFLGRIHPKKGVDILIKAYAKVYGVKSDKLKSETLKSGANSISVSAFKNVSISAFSNAPPLLVIAGPGLETDYGKEMQKLAADLCPPTSVLWPGMLTGDAKWGALYHAEAFVLTSHQENFGIAVVEALACGKPVLISNQINIWREIEEDEAGLVADDTLAGAEQLFRNWESLSSEEKAAMKRAAKASYENRFGIALAAKNLIAIIEVLMMSLRAPEKLAEKEIEIPG
jgi:glycosyltransferase involved in cell wall biosynthesis